MSPTGPNRFAKATTTLEQADALVAMNNAMTDLATYLPGYDDGRGEIPADED